jgi:hypothetical protein
MVDDHNHYGLQNRRCNHGRSLHRPRWMLTSDDVATVIGICVSLLIMLAGALVCIACFGLLMVLMHIGLQLLTS